MLISGQHGVFWVFWWWCHPVGLCVSQVSVPSSARQWNPTTSASPRHHLGGLPSLSMRKSCRRGRDTKIVWLNLRKHEQQRDLCARGSPAEGKAHVHRHCWCYECGELPPSHKLERHTSSAPCREVCKAGWLNGLINSFTSWLHPQQRLLESVWNTCPKLPWVLLLIFGVALYFLKMTPLA